MIFWVLVIFGAAGAFLALRSCNFYKMWAILFNIIISIYISVMVSPFIIKMIPSDISGLDYQIAACVLLIALLLFGILQAIAVNFFTGDCEIKFPKLFDSIGSAILGFLSGWFTVSFLVLIVCIMPFMKGKSTPQKHCELAVKSIETSSNIISTLSLQRYKGQAHEIVQNLTTKPLSNPTNDNEIDPETDNIDTNEYNL